MQKQLYNPFNLNFYQNWDFKKCKLWFCDSDYRETIIYTLLGTLKLLLQCNLQI